MTKTQFKRDYQSYRESYRNIQEAMQGMYCGDDDATGEEWDYHTEKWLKTRPALARVLEERYDQDQLEEPVQYRLQRWQYHKKQYRFTGQRLTFQHSKV